MVQAHRGAMTEASTNTTESTPAVTWHPGDYAPFVTGQGAIKLSASAVAPLVAAARGFATVTEDTIKEARKQWGLPGRSSAQGRRIDDEIRAGDLMIMPWFEPDPVLAARRGGVECGPSAVQYRPGFPDADDDGKERKYEFVTGSKTPVGIHPSTPTSWLGDASVPMMVAEGQLKADAAVSGHLIASGVPLEELRLTDSDVSVAVARKRLHDLMDALPAESRLPVASIAGVWNWRTNANDWWALSPKGRRIILGIDGDVATKLQVWKATKNLFDYVTRNLKATPALLAPRHGDALLGIDDFLADHGTWVDLMAQVGSDNDFPERPASDDSDRVGEHRVSDDLTRVEQCVAREDDNGRKVDIRWVPVMELGGRIATITVAREPSDKETRTGEFGRGVSQEDRSAEVGVEVEVGWMGADDEPARSVILGPAKILNYPPAVWEQKGATIPPEVLCHPAWPPTGVKGETWLRAVKEHKRDQTVERVRWSRMGWVPTRSSKIPAFVVGQHVICDPGMSEEVISGVDDDTLTGASNFGLGPDDERPFTDPEYMRELREDCERTMRIYLLSGAWSNRAVAATVFAAGLRPCLPLRNTTTLWCMGPPGKGKSWTAAGVMAFWARYPDAWSNGRLPGSAKDTFAAMENAVAQSMVWVIDDVAPSASKLRQQGEQGTVEDIVRAVFNGQGKSRMNPDGSTRKTRIPRALLVVTAENEPKVGSIRERSVALEIGEGALGSADATRNLVDLATNDGAPARVAQGLVKYLRHRARMHQKGWAGLYADLEQAKINAAALASSIMADRGAEARNTKRASDLGGDLIVAMSVFGQMLLDLDAAEDLCELASSTEQLQRDMCVLAAESYETARSSSNGRSLLRAISQVLRSGRAHIVNIEDPKSPPGGNSVETMAMGWSLRAGEFQPGGSRIGWWMHDNAGDPFVLLDSENAFNEARRCAEDLIPSGQSAKASWGAFYDEGLNHRTQARITGGNGKKLNRSRVRVKGSDQRLAGVAVEMDLLMRGDATPVTDPQDDSGDDPVVDGDAADRGPGGEF